MTIPVTILTGFLGAGKTTLLNAALRTPALSRTLVVMNEYGAVAIDHDLVKQVQEEVILLESGCVCCTVRGDLVETLLHRVSDSLQHFDRVLIETTGLADPTPLLSTFLKHPELSLRFHIDALVTAVDAEHGAATLKAHEEARKQVVLADDIILTKVDRADGLASLRAEVSHLAPQARIFEAVHGELDWNRLLQWTVETIRQRLDIPNLSDESAHQNDEFQTFSVRSNRAVDYSAIAMWMSFVTQFHSEKILRIKGLLRLHGEPGPMLVQAVQHAVYPAYTLERWPSEDQASRLAVILRDCPEELTKELKKSLEDLMLPKASMLLRTCRCPAAVRRLGEQRDKNLDTIV